MRPLCLLLVLALVPLASYGGTILMWNFETGSAAFTSGYTPSTQTVPPTGMTDGHYTLVSDPSEAHQLWSSFGDHTTGSGNMMVVNSATAPDQAVWIADGAGLDLMTGARYELSFFAAEVYRWDYDHGGPGVGSPASLAVYLDGALLGTFTLSQAPGIWTEYTVSFDAPSAHPDLRIVNTNTAWQGNDFALDDITLHQPEPSAWMMGVGGVAAMLLLRRRRRAS